ncbi:MAG TPA: hypothetical protein VH592_18280 [Gemmataceae bacterium]
MERVTADEIRSFAKSLGGKPLHTLAQGKEFTVEVDGDYILYTPASTGKQRRHRPAYLEAVCERFSDTNSYHSSTYRPVTLNPSYTLAVIDAYLKSKGRHC